ncbi:hypothetical protein F3Y22_tig00004072pilonHSYRG00237 [Hibiscus syriacus]|uniref:Uncharacterized protein n=1 Tax=Hibiscus syriacus TaxID=106335 RepID=A0A6A3CNJ2_HIBSY|nr:hypothetical protein F3Y22_tig00004072pilonHSYRG00237 [Hibiscus syriacus]
MAGCTLTVGDANLSYGGLVGVEGLSPGRAQLSLSLFEDPPVCKHQEVVAENLGRKMAMGFQVQRMEIFVAIVMEYLAFRGIMRTFDDWCDKKVS